MYQTLKKQVIYYQKIGQGKDLVMLHGWKQNVSTWWPLVDLLKNHFTLWMIDLPGFGKSENPKKIWGVEDYAACISLFIKENKIRKPAVLGHSFGGAVTIKLASSYPSLISKLILEASSGLRAKPTLLSRLLLVFSRLIKLAPNLLNIKNNLRSWFYQSIRSDYLATGDLKKIYLKIIRQDLTSDAKKIPHETLIIWGENDREVPLKKGLALYKLITNSRIEVIEGIGHFPHLKNPVKFITYVKDFI